MSDMCWTPGCKGRIIPSREIRATVTRAGECSVCGGRFKRFGTGDWKFVTELAPCTVEGCGGSLQFEVIPKNTTYAMCDTCGARHAHSPEGDISVDAG